jgi:two-component system NtrC family sensor kinase
VTLRDSMRPAGATALPKAAAPADQADRASSPRRRGAWRAPLAAKLTAALVGLVVLVLVVNGVVNTWLNYDRARHAALEVQEEKARSAAERVSQFLTEIETQLGWTIGAEWRRTQPDQQRYDFIRLLRQAPAITELSFIDGQGKEQLKVSRLEPDSVGSGKDFSKDPRFVEAVAHKTWFGPVEFRRGSEPYMTIAVAHVGREPGVTVADVNLKLVWDVITSIHVGEKGYAYVVDDKGRLIAHPDLSLVLRDTDMSQLPQVRQALQNKAPNEQTAPMMVATRVGMAEIATSLDGASVLTAYAVAPRTNWIVFVQSPVAEALAPVYRSLLQTLALLGLGLLLALIVGGFLARRMVVPIRRLQQGAERLGAGDLSQRLDIRTGDEIETLADRFNQMAARIQESYETLEAKVEARTADLNEALQQQTATANVLKVISRSAFDLEGVFSTLLGSAVALSGGNSGVLCVRDGEVFRVKSFINKSPDLVRFLTDNPVTPGAGSVMGRVALSGRVESIEDTLSDPSLKMSSLIRQTDDDRALVGVPLLREGRIEGGIVLGRREPGLFAARAIELVQTFADQAVIAIENVRLFDQVQAKTRDLEESLQQQTATADVLKVISRSAFDLQPVLDTLVESAFKLCGAGMGLIYLRSGDVFECKAIAGAGVAEASELFKGRPIRAGRSTAAERVIMTGEVQCVEDFFADPEFDPRVKAVIAAAPDSGIAALRSTLAVPLKRDAAVVGVIAIARAQTGPFPSRQIELLETFADQAVIAIENVRLFDQVQAKTRDLEESLAQQTATADVLKVISRSVMDLDPVLQTLIDTAVRLARGSRGTIWIKEGDFMVARAFHRNVSEELRQYLSSTRWPIDGDSHQMVAAREARVVHIADLSKVDDAITQEVKKRAAFGAGLWVPLIGEGQTIGVFGVPRDEPVAFTDREIEIVKTFADQAVIAIQNSRLFEQVQAKTRDLEESLAQQTATADVLKVISRSAFDLQAVFDTLISTAVDLNNAYSGAICVRDGDVFRYKASRVHEGDDEVFRYLVDHPAAPDRSTVVGRTILSGQVEQIADILEDKDYAVPIATLGNPARALLGVPLLGKERVEGAIVLTRREPGHYPPRQIETLKTFADQAVIAIENARLLDQVQARTKELAQTVDDLRSAQDRLIQSEKLASLGQLTAGIAHEIKNPLNFVNNFAALSRELIGELKEIVATTKPDEKTKEEIDEITGMLEGNLAKVVQHGKRADSIVKNMLLHSRESSGEHRMVDLNATVEEAVNLAYHGARAEKPGFNVTLLKDFDPSVGEIDIYPQEFTRVLLNLISNGFYAATKRKAEGGDAIEPILKTSTKNLGEKVEIKIRDNGTGIPPEIKAKMFNPFFTTKPAGEGTGLGLSLSYDIVVKQHGGTIDVDTKPGEFTEFILVIPRSGAQSNPKASQ